MPDPAPALHSPAPSGSRAPGRRRLATAIVATATALLAGCGGGVFLSYEFPIGFVDDRGPSVQISALPASVPAGAALILGATAVDEDGIAEVSLYRVDGSGFATFLAADRSPPYEWTTLIPADGRPTVSYFARAVDGRGRVGDSAVVSAGIRY